MSRDNDDGGHRYRSVKRFVLVTGMPRSGTTAVGRMLASSSATSELYEPMNGRSGLREVEHYFQGPVRVDVPHARIDAQLEKIFSLRMRCGNGYFVADSGLRRLAKRVLGSRTRRSVLRSRFDPRVKTVVWKDPFASLLVPYIVRDHRVPVVVTVRSPMAVAASFKRLDWRFNVERTWVQVAGVAPDIADAIGDPSRRSDTQESVPNAAFLWSLIYGYLAATVGHHDDVLWMNVQRLIDDPVAMYEKVFAHGQMPFTASAKRAIRRE